MDIRCAVSFRHDPSHWRPCDDLKWISNEGKKWFCNPRICLEYLWMYSCWLSLLPSEFPHDFLWKLWKHPNFTTGLPVSYFTGIRIRDILPRYCRYRSQDLTTNMRGKFDFFYSPWDHEDGTETGRLWWRKTKGMPPAAFHSINNMYLC